MCGVVLLSSYNIRLGWDVWCCFTQLLAAGMCGVVLLSSYNICLGWDVWCCSTQLLQYLPRLGCVVLFYSALTYLPRLGCVVLFYSALTIST